MSTHLKNLNIELNKKIIVVDNEADHLSMLEQRFKDLGLPCLSIHYEQAEFETLKLKGVRYAFFDLNITDANFNLNDESEISKDNPDLKRVFNELVYAITEVLDKNNGPYILVLWTDNEFLVNPFLDYVNSRELEEFPLPVSILVLSKAVFRTDNQSLDRILEETDKFQSLKSLANFENLVETSISETISSLLSTVKDQKILLVNGDMFDLRMTELFKYIALSNFGKIAYEAPTKAIVEGILPLLNYNITKNCIEEKVFGDLIDADQLDAYDEDFKSLRATIGDNFSISALNSAYHIEDNSKRVDARGATSIIDEHSVYFSNKFGIEIIDIFKSAFDKLYSKLIDQNLTSDVKIIMTELSAACDYSQNKDRFNKYILGCSIPEKAILKCVDDNKKKIRSMLKPKHEACYVIDSSFDINNSDVYLAYSLNHVITVDPIDIEKLTYCFTLKKEMMDLIGNKYSNHVSRIGITAF